ncbi:MAG: hypothetical protein PHO15_01375 [Eubacteriales bacterium]|nr:hypothetical protein [Eubacteriales bacterium]
MIIFFTLFRQKDLKQEFRLKGKYLEHFIRAFPDYDDRFKEIKEGVAYFAGRDNIREPIRSLAIKSYVTGGDEISFRFEGIKKRGIASGYLSDGIHNISKQYGWLNEDNMPPIVCIVPQKEAKALCNKARQIEKMDALMEKGDYKSICMLFAPLKDLKDNASVWNDPGMLYRLGRACSKLATTLLVKAGETKKLGVAGRYREYCIAFLERGAALEQDSARCATALAYRYYSNVHELMRPGERRDQNLEEEIEKANEWLSRALEIYPQSVKNHYRKGKLIIEKQAPYLLYGKKSFGQGEAGLLRDIREVGEEHLASAIAIYEALTDEQAKEVNRREYAKALFVLGGYYLADANLPMHEYFCKKIANKENNEAIEPIDKLNIESARENLEKCFYTETDMPLCKLDYSVLAAAQKQWARSPSEKLYRLGCAYSAMAFIALAEGGSCVGEYANTAAGFLKSAKKVSDMSKDRKRNTWHISEKIAWVLMISGKYGEAAKLLMNTRAGYAVNTCAIALLLTGRQENLEKAKAALQHAAGDKNNLAEGLSRVLYACALSKSGEDYTLQSKDLSAKNKKLADILGVKCSDS